MSIDEIDLRLTPKKALTSFAFGEQLSAPQLHLGLALPSSSPTGRPIEVIRKIRNRRSIDLGVIVSNSI
jgi:hypothetical protein